MGRLEDMLLYSKTVNKDYIDACAKLAPAEESNALMSHTILAVEIWNGRILGIENPSRWEAIEAADFHSRNNEAYNKSLEILTSRDQSDLIAYTNSRKESFSNTVGDILFHLVNHTTHHRAQIARIIRAQEMVPPLSDYIFYLRNS